MKKLNNREIEEPGQFRIDLNSFHYLKYWEGEKYTEIFKEYLDDKQIPIWISIIEHQKWLLPEERKMTQEEKVKMISNIEKGLKVLRVNFKLTWK